MQPRICVIAVLIALIPACQKQTISTNANLTPTNTNKINTSNPGTRLTPREFVKFESADKVEISGLLYQSRREKSPAVLLLHQWQTDSRSFDDLAAMLQRNDFNVLAIDGRGFGESVRTTDGKTVSAGRTDADVNGMKADVENAIGFLLKHESVDPARIAIVGASYGSSLALMCAAGNEKIKAVAMLSPGLNYFGNLPIGPAIKMLGNRRLLLVAAEDDRESADAVRKLKSSCGANCDAQIYESGGHGTDILKAEVGLDVLIDDFLEKTL